MTIMRLLLARHGHAVDKQTDPHCPLSDQGRAEVEKMAQILSEKGATVERIFHSGKTRAAETAEILGRVLAPDCVPESMSGLNPLDPCEAAAREIPRYKCDLLLVSHLPFLGNLLFRLVELEPGQQPVIFTTGTVACLEKAKKAGWQLSWSVSPNKAGE
jgi:phosphohistidine phosphatase